MQRDAWSLTLADGHGLAIAQQQVQEYLSNISAHIVPGCRSHCQQVVLWRKKVLPLWGAEKLDAARSIQVHKHVLIISYQDLNADSIGQADWIAICLSKQPQLISVSDGDQCEPSAEQEEYWKYSLLACFRYLDEIIPIVDFSRLTPSYRH